MNFKTWFFNLERVSPYLFVVSAVIVAFISLLLSNRMVKRLAEEERVKIEIWAMATESMATDKETDLTLVLKILKSNSTIPVILYDKSRDRLQSHNIKLPENNVEPFLRAKKENFAKRGNHIMLDEVNQILYYDDSYTLKQLQMFPYIEMLVIALFIGVAFFALNRSMRAEQNSVWVGLSKETAHQLGTPISSLIAWIEYLKLKYPEPDLISDIEKDLGRLQVVSDRFSKIGAECDLIPTDLREQVSSSLEYVKKRISKEVEITLSFPDYPVILLLNRPLFDWVIENLTKNGVDAMKGKGELIFSILSSDKGSVYFDVTDSGKGIAKSKFKTIFSPGYTTKERGWGLGLSLVKRIVEVNHKGRIFVKHSELGSGTTFRIVLNRLSK